MSPGYVFLSYSRADLAAVQALHDALTAVGVPCWFDGDIPTGARWEQELLARVDGCAALLVMTSPAAQASRWVRLEAGRARAFGRPVHMVGVGAAPPTGLVRQLRRLVAKPPPGHPRPGPAVLVGDVPPRLPHFVGRADLLVDLEAGLYQHGRVALRGVAGIGKTALAAEYVYRRASDYDRVSWLAAPDVAPAPTGQRWLVVVDGAGPAAQLAHRLPRAGLGHVIVTTREDGWTGAVEVGPLPPDEALTLLREQAPGVAASTGAALVAVLGAAPLMVERAAGYLAATGTAPDDLLRLLHERGIDLLGLDPLG